MMNLLTRPILALWTLLFFVLSSLPGEASLSGRKIGLDPGHGAGGNPGVVIAEGTWVLDAALRARTHLENHGAQVIMTRTTGADPALSTRVNILNSNNVHRAVSLHSNAASAAAQGMESYYCSQNAQSATSRTFADQLRIRCLDMVHNRNRGTKECLDAGRNIHFTIIRNTTMPSSLPEYYFHTNDWENRNIHNTITGRENVARSLYAAVCDHYGVTPTFEAPPPPSTRFSTNQWVRTTSETLNLRAGPGTDHEIIQALPRHTVAQVKAHQNNGIRNGNNNWWYVEVHPSGIRGWLAEVFLEATSAPPASPWPDVIVDNSSPGFSASANWATATWAADKFGADYRHRETQAVSDPARWSAQLPGSGTYDLFVWWSAGTNRPAVAPYFVNHAGGRVRVDMDQTTNGGRWNFLGRFEFAHNSQNQVELSCWTTLGRTIIADAVRFVAVDIVAPPRNYALTTQAQGSGTVQRSPNAAQYLEGTQVQLTAVPGANHEFSHWSGDASGTESPITITMDAAKSVTAHFALRAHALITFSDGPGAVERTPDEEEIVHGGQVTLQAVPEPGYEFAGWSGDRQSSVNPLTFTVEGPMSITARFARTFGGWAKQHFSAEERQDESISGDQVDLRGDGVPNLLRYALGLSPREPAEGRLPQSRVATIASAGNRPYLTLEFAHPTDVSGVEFAVEVTSDPAQWTEVALLLSSEDDGSGRTIRVYRDPVAASQAGQRFMRLRVRRVEN